MPPSLGPHRAVTCAIITYIVGVAILWFAMGKDVVMPAGALFFHLIGATTATAVASKLSRNEWGWIRHFITLVLILLAIRLLSNPEFMGIGPAEVKIKQQFNIRYEQLITTLEERHERRLQVMYAALKAERANLNSADPAAVALYNKHLTEYDAFRKVVEAEKARAPKK